MSDKKEHILDVHNKITSNEFEKLIETNVKWLLDNPKSAHELPPMMCWGSPGVGKSSIVKSVAEKLGIEFIDVRLAQMEPCDIKGLPVPDETTKTMNWFVNGSWPTDVNGKGIIFLDELSAADRSVAVAAYELILDRRLGKLYSVPDGYYIIGAGNLTTDRAVATTMSSALANRFMHVEIEADAEDWIKWAQKNDIHPSVTGYISYRPNCLFNMENENLERGWPSPRSWHRVSQMVKMYSEDEHLLRKIVYGLVGPAKGVEFMEFHLINKKFDNVLDMMYGRIPVKIPVKNDEKYAMCSTLTYLLWKSSNMDDQHKRLTGFFNILMELSPDFSAMCMMGALNAKNDGVKNASRDIFHHEMYKAWSNKYGEALKKRLLK